MNRPKTKPVPPGYHSVTPYLMVRDAAKLIELLAKAFGAELLERHDHPDGKIMHAEVRIGNSPIMISESCDTMEGMGSVQSVLYLYVEDAEAVFNQAVSAGCREVMPVDDQFWGDRMGGVVDPWGNRYWISTHIEDVSKEELDLRASAFAASMNPPTP
ncbi:MAG: VOC family protein [Puniceicoccaceae bacterium]|nr:MAG: VOC family protein [Puniceicoccaceae bacterium]